MKNNPIMPSLWPVFREKNISLQITYDHYYNEPAQIVRLLEHYKRIVSGIANNPGQKLSELSLLSPEEEQKLLIDWNDTHADYPKDQCIHEVFADQARRRPNATAVVFEDQKLSYKELDQKSTELGKYLQSLGVKPETLVAICVECSSEMIIGLLGILKAGGAYLPLDPDYPQDRLHYMFEDSRANLLLSQSHLADRLRLLTNNSLEITYLDQDWKTIRSTAEAQKTLSRNVRSNHLAYVIYTSGSTGNPKGVMVEHRSLVNMSLDQIRRFNVTEEDQCLQFASACFDASLCEIFTALLSGATLVVMSNKEKHFDNAFHQYCHRHQISIAFSSCFISQIIE